MLSRQNDIYTIKPPFLILFGDGSWRVARELFPYLDGVGFLEPFADHANHEQPSGMVPGIPWHVGDEVWELDYNAQIMTLNHPHYHRHPAWRLWLQWLSQQRQLPGGQAH